MWTRQRAELFAAAGEGGVALAGPRDRELVGRDFAAGRGTPARRRPRLWVPLLLGAVAAALWLSALRVSILRVRYELAAALESETALLERRRAATVAVRELRDPARLHGRAAELGLGRPERVVEIAPAVRP
jgi:hypothetical protein